MLQTYGHRTIPCFLHRLTGIGVTRWWLGPFLIFSTGWLELVLQTHDSHKTIPCFHHRLTGLGVTDTRWSQEYSLFSPQVDWNWCYRYTLVTGPFLVFSTGWLELVLQIHVGHRTIPCFLHRLTRVGVTDAHWSQDHSLFSPQADWNSLNWCYTYRHALVTGLIVFSTGSLELVYFTDTWWSQDHSLFSPQVHWNWCTLQTCFLHRLTGVGVTDTHWSQDHSLFSPQADCVYICVCFETKWSGDFICPTGGVLTNVSVVCMVPSYLLGIVLCLLVRLWVQTGLPVPLECQGKIVSHLCFSTACLTDP